MSEFEINPQASEKSLFHWQSMDMKYFNYFGSCESWVTGGRIGGWGWLVFS